MEYVKKLNVLFIYGGKTSIKGEEQILSDAFILNLLNLEWKEIRFINPLPSMERMNFCSASNGT